MKTEPMPGKGVERQWGCELKEIFFTRGCNSLGFELTISNLFLFAGSNGNNKLPLMGRTGSGKSTLLNLMSAMDLPVQGTVSWTFPDGEAIKWDRRGLTSATASMLRSKYFGFAFQDSTLIPHLNVLDNLCYPLQLKRVSQRDAISRAQERLDAVLIDNEEVSDISMRYPSQLSGGQRQRVALAQAMIHDPNVLFADEPTGSLDSITRRQVMRVLYNWVDEEPDRRSMLWVTHHDTDPAEAGLTKRLFIDDGICDWDPPLSGAEKSAL